MQLKNKVLISYLVVLFLLGGQALAQQVNIKKDVPPPLCLTIEQMCTATITSPSPMEVYVIASAKGARLGSVAKITSEVFKIHPGANHYSVANIPLLKETWIAPQFDQIIKQAGLFPEDNYEIFIQLLTKNDSLLDDDKIMNHRVQYIQIKLVAPENGGTITAPHPSFQWSIIGIPPKGIEYKLKICEVMKNQTIADAINNLPFYEVKDLTATFYPYPLSAQTLDSGGYCWQVTGLVGDYPIATSEIWGLKTPFLFAPTFVVGQVVHIFGVGGSEEYGWLVSIDKPNKGYIRFGPGKMPALKFCNWIKIIKCHDEEEKGTVIDDYEIVEEPKTEEKLPPESTTPTTPVVPPPIEKPKPPPCKEGKERNESETKTNSFEFLNEDSKIEIKVRTDVGAVLDAGKRMAELWRTPGKIKELCEKLGIELPEGTGGFVIDQLIALLERGADILDALDEGVLRRRLRTINIDLYIFPTVKKKVEWYTVEVCKNGEWKKVKKCKEAEEKGAYSAGVTINFGDDNWSKIEDSASPQLVDLKKLDTFIKEFVAQKLLGLSQQQQAYEEFMKDCNK